MLCTSCPRLHAPLQFLPLFYNHKYNTWHNNMQYVLFQEISKTITQHTMEGSTNLNSSFQSFTTINTIRRSTAYKAVHYDPQTLCRNQFNCNFIASHHRNVLIGNGKMEKEKEGESPSHVFLQRIDFSPIWYKHIYSNLHGTVKPRTDLVQSKCWVFQLFKRMFFSSMDVHREKMQKKIVWFCTMTAFYEARLGGFLMKLTKIN